MKALVGCTGFVGSNLYDTCIFDRAYNSQNISEAYGTSPELLVYAGIRAEKYLANRFPENDMDQIRQAEENISRIAPKKLVLISTIDVFADPRNVDENATVEATDLQPYGCNRYYLEQWVREYFPDALIVRLPGLFGKGLKKNFIYDLIHVIPSMLKEAKMKELEQKAPELKQYYALQNNGFYKVRALSAEEEYICREKFRTLGFNAMNFTDSRSFFQFYDLSRLWSDIEKSLKAGVTLLHTATEPVSAGELYRYLTGKEFVNRLDGVPAYYDYRTIHTDILGGRNGYICDRAIVLEEIKSFICESGRLV